VSDQGQVRSADEAMLAEIGVGSFDELIAQVPPRLRLAEPLALAAPLAESELRRLYSDLSRKNYDPANTPSFLGGGLYDHVIPAAIEALTWRSEFYTAYTPYQPEVAQGTLAAIFEFQTMICELTGMDVANASMYDGASAAAEALLLARSVNRGGRALLAPGVSPRVRGVIATHLEGAGVTLETLPEEDGRIDVAALPQVLRAGPPACALLVQQPNFFGLLEPLDRLPEALGGAAGERPHLVVSADPLSLGILAPPGRWGADTVVGDLQPLGIPAQFGGPTGGYFATRAAHVRRLPGRLVAEARDAGGRRGFTLTLQTREQHIRREKATSNICTNSALLALRATIYLALVGPGGIREVARQCYARAHHARARLAALPGVRASHAGPFFREFAIDLGQPAEALVAGIHARHGILAGIPLGRFYPGRANELLVAVTEKRTRADIEALAAAVAEGLAPPRGAREKGNPSHAKP
jgi:glycine dehydrogenase subunit 1